MKRLAAIVFIFSVCVGVLLYGQNIRVDNGGGGTDGTGGDGSGSTNFPVGVQVSTNTSSPLLGIPGASGACIDCTILTDRGVVTGLFSGAASGSRLLSGGVTWLSNLVFEASALTYIINGTYYSSTGGVVTLTAADPTDPRIDVIVADTNGAVTFVTGTPAADPARPSIDPAAQIELTFVTIAAGATTPNGVSADKVYDEAVEWTPTTNAATVNAHATANPAIGSKHVRYTSAASSAQAKFTTNAAVSVANYGALSMRIKNNAAWSPNRQLLVWIDNGASSVGVAVLMNNLYGFNASNTNGYQLVVIPRSDFNLTGTQIDTVRIQVWGSGSSMSFDVDDVRFTSGVPQGQHDRAYAFVAADIGNANATQPEDSIFILGAGGITTIGTNTASLKRLIISNTQPASITINTNNSGGATGELTISGTNVSAVISNTFITPCSRVLLTQNDTPSSFVNYQYTRSNGFFTVHIASPPGAGNSFYFTYHIADFCNTNLPGTIVVTTNGCSVCTYADCEIDMRGDFGLGIVSGVVAAWTNANTVNPSFHSQGTAANRPGTNTGLNGKTVLTFDNTDILTATTNTISAPTSVAIWLNPTESGPSVDNALLAYEPGGAGNIYLYSSRSFSNGVVGIGTFSTFYGASTVTIPSNSWSHLTIVLTATNQFQAYLNGVLKETVTAGETLSIPVNRISVAGAPYVGSLAEVRWFCRALTPSEVFQLYQNGY